MDPAKIAIIVDLPPLSTVKQLRTTLGHTRYYRKFIRGYVEVTSLMEIFLKKDIKFQWKEQCQESLDVLKYKMVTVPILVSILGKIISCTCRCIVCRAQRHNHTAR